MAVIISRLLWLMIVLSYVMNSGAKILDMMDLPGEKLGDIFLFDDQNKIMQIGEKYKGKKVIVVVCADYCKPCIEELKIFNELAQKNKDKYNFLVVSISDPDDMHYVIDKYKLYSLKMFYDRGMTILKRVQIRSIPLVLFLDRNHVVSDKVSGYVDWNDTRNKLLLQLYSNDVDDDLTEKEKDYLYGADHDSGRRDVNRDRNRDRDEEKNVEVSSNGKSNGKNNAGNGDRKNVSLKKFKYRKVKLDKKLADKKLVVRNEMLNKLKKVYEDKGNDVYVIYYKKKK